MLNIPTIEKANNYLEEAAGLNPGVWIKHSKNVALAAKLIAECCPDLDSETAYILGLLHDLGRRGGKMQARHALEGYKFMLSQGYVDCARICMTHTFQYKDIDGIYDSWDCSEEDIEFIKNYLNVIEYDDYDLLIQLCDALSLDNGFCLLENKMVTSVLKFGIKKTIVMKWKATFDIKDYFERKIRCSIYQLLPGDII